MNADYTVIDCNPHRGISLTGMSLCLLMLCFLWVFPCIWKEFKAEVKITENCLIILAHSAIRKGMGNGFLWIPRLFNHFIPLTVLWSEGVIKNSQDKYCSQESPCLPHLLLLFYLDYLKFPINFPMVPGFQRYLQYMWLGKLFNCSTNWLLNT